MDLTTLSSDDTTERVKRLCAKAKQPLSLELIDKLGVNKLKPRVAAVCVYHSYVNTAVNALKNSGIPVAAVSAGFPHGLNSISRRIEEIKDSIASGAREIDIVITRANVFNGNWEALYNEIATFKKACGNVHLKTILGTGELGTFRNIAKASLVCMMGGADFIKTSTGKEGVNATLPVSLVMIRMIREYFNSTGFYVGFKPAGGIRTAKQSLEWLILMKEELGMNWIQPNLFRFGASGLLNDIERQLEHFVKGNYSASYRHPVA
tara:strand:+ start:7 stop:798 length:792 start_codon:yes stop_codon:yes gene_type:complete